MDSFEKYYTLALRYLARRPRSEKEVRDYLVKKMFKRYSGNLVRRGSSRISLGALRQAQGEKDSGVASTPQNDKQKVIELIIHKLTEQKFLNDEEFAKWFIEQRKRFRKKSDRLIKLELKQKGISTDVFEKAEEGIEHKKTDHEAARELVEQKIGKYKHLSRQELYQKLGAILARRGFDWDTIKTTIDEKLKKGV